MLRHTRSWIKLTHSLCTHQGCNAVSLWPWLTYHKVGQRSKPVNIEKKQTLFFMTVPRRTAAIIDRWRGRGDIVYIQTCVICYLRFVVTSWTFALTERKEVLPRFELRWTRYLMATSTNNSAGFWYYDQYVCSSLTIIRWCILEQEKWWLLHCTSKILEFIFCLQSNLNSPYETWCGRSLKGCYLDPRRDEKHAVIKQNCNSVTT